MIDDFDVLDLPGDDALVDRLVAGALGEAPVLPVLQAPAAAPRKKAVGAGRTILYAVAASLLLGAFGGAGRRRCIRNLGCPQPRAGPGELGLELRVLPAGSAPDSAGCNRTIHQSF